MIRYTLLWLMVGGILTYAWKDWCRALCLLVVMLAVLERPDMPRTILGIPGLNPFNLGLVGIVVACIFTRRREETWDLPAHINLLFLTYVGIIVVAFARLAVDREALSGAAALMDERVPGLGALVTEYVLDTLKWIVPGVLLAYGCRDKSRMKFAVFCLAALYVLLALQVIRQMPLSYALDGESLQQRALRVLDLRVGYHRVDLAMILAGAPWLLLSARYLVNSAGAKLGLTALGVVTFAGLLLTGGRTGYLSWAVAGMVMSVLRWRHYLALAPLAISVALAFVPGVSDRLLQGITLGAVEVGESTVAVSEVAAVDTESLTSGRSTLWPFVVEKIRENPIIGFGRLAHKRTGVAEEVHREAGEFFGHPHNAYLEFTLDNGVIGLAVVLGFFAVILYKGTVLFRDRGDPVSAAVGGMTTGLTVAFLAACVGSQTFYPITGTVGMWCAMGLTIRVWQQRAGATVPARVATRRRAQAGIADSYAGPARTRGRQEASSRAY